MGDQVTCWFNSPVSYFVTTCKGLVFVSQTRKTDTSILPANLYQPILPILTLGDPYHAWARLTPQSPVCGCSVLYCHFCLWQRCSGNLGWRENLETTGCNTQKLWDFWQYTGLCSYMCSKIQWKSLCCILDKSISGLYVIVLKTTPKRPQNKDIHHEIHRAVW